MPDAYSRRVVGWSMSHTPTAALTANALGRRSSSAAAPGLCSSMGTVGDGYGNPLIEALWSRRQVELLDTRRWKTRIELANAIFEYIEIFHNRRRRHSALGMRTPIEYGDTRRLMRGTGASSRASVRSSTSGSGGGRRNSRRFALNTAIRYRSRRQVRIAEAGK